MFWVLFLGGNIIFGCEFGWYRVGIFCFLFYLSLIFKWSDVWRFCYLFNVDFVVVKDVFMMDVLVNRRRELKFDICGEIYFGLIG